MRLYRSTYIVISQLYRTLASNISLESSDIPNLTSQVSELSIILFLPSL